MRCKNCGSENNDNLYICQNCGSPLYDDDDDITRSDGSTRMFTPPVNPNQQFDDPTANAYHEQRAAERERQKEEAAKKKQVAVIVVLLIVLIAIIAGIIIAIAHGKGDNGDTTVASFSSSEGIEDESDVSSSSRKSESTEENEKEKTTESTTSERSGKDYRITVSTNDAGNADGGGTYKKGDTATVWCSADDDSEFIGWYKNGECVSTSTRYTFTVSGNAHLVARFKKKSSGQKTTAKPKTTKATTKSTTKKTTKAATTEKEKSTQDSGSDDDSDEQII